MAYSPKLQLELLQETTDEMGRNGCAKILIVNGHGGNASLLPFFAQSQLAAPHGYVVYIWMRHSYPAGRPALKTREDSHAGESEPHTPSSRVLTSSISIAPPRNPAPTRTASISPKDVYTGIWWIAKFPNRYARDGSAATQELGEFDMKAWSDDVANTIRAIKADQVSARLQRRFYEDAQHPLRTKQ